MGDSKDAAQLQGALSSVTDSATRNTHMYATATKLGHKMVLLSVSSPHVGRYGPNDAEPLTHFHSVVVPTLSVRGMYQELRHRRHTSAPLLDSFDDDTGLIAVTLMLRYQRTTGLPITTAMLHRLFITALLVASKSHHDCSIRNSAMARRFGISLREMNCMERHLLSGLDYRTAVFACDVDDTMATLTSACPVGWCAASSASGGSSSAATSPPALPSDESEGATPPATAAAATSEVEPMPA